MIKLLIAGLARAGSCHTRATRVRFAQFFAGAICHRISQGSLQVARGVQVDQSRSAAGMAQAVHQLTQVGPGVRDQEVPGTAQVMEVNAGLAGNSQSRQPYSFAEVAVPQQRASRARKYQGLRLGPDLTAQMITDVRQDQ